MSQLSEALDKWDFRQNVPLIKIFTKNEYYKGWFARYIFDIFNDSKKLGSLKTICYLILLSSDSQLNSVNLDTSMAIARISHTFEFSED